MITFEVEVLLCIRGFAVNVRYNFAIFVYDHDVQKWDYTIAIFYSEINVRVYVQ